MDGAVHEGQIARHDRAIAFAFMMSSVGVLGGHEVSGHHRGDEAGDKKRKADSDGDGQAKLAEVLAGNAAHKADGHKDRDDGEGGGNHRKADFIGSVDRRAVGGFAHSDVSGDVLDFHNRIVDKDAGGKRDGQKADKVEREAQKVHDPEGWHGRQGQGHGGDQRGAPVAQEGEHHKHGEDRAFDQRVDRAFVIAIGVEHGFIDKCDPDGGVVGAQRVERGVDGFGHRHLRCAFGAEDGKGDDLIAVQPRERFEVLIAVDHFAQIGEPHMATARQEDWGFGQTLDGLGIAERADGLLGGADLGLAAADVGVGEPKLVRHGGGGDAVAFQLDRIQRDPHLAVGPAIAFDLANAGAALKHADDGVIDEP